MAIGIDGQSYLEVTVGGKMLPLESMRFLGLLISSHILYHLPMGQLAFVDMFDIIRSKLTVADGTSLVITMGRTKERAIAYNFRIFNVLNDPVADGTQYTISFIHTADKWRLTPFTGAMVDMTSSDALNKLATSCGMDFKGDSTNDSQTWYPLADTPCKFARRIANLGYVSSGSCMLMGVTFAGTLKYVNLDAIDFKQSGIPHFTAGSEDGIWVSDIACRSNSGTTNQTGGYATIFHQIDIDGVQDTDDTVHTSRISNTMNMHKDVSGTTGAGRMEFLPLDSGNNHDNALTATYQNRRRQALLNWSVSVLTPLDPKVELLDPIALSNFITSKQSGVSAIDKGSSGFYLTVGKACHIGSTLQYNERYQFIREGLDADNSTKVI